MSERMDRPLDIIAEYAKAGKGTIAVVPRIRQQAEWSDIQKVIRDGRAKELLPVGSDLYFKIEGGELAHVVVVALDHYGHEDHDAVFWFRKIVDCRPINGTLTNEGGFAGSEIRKWLNGEFFEKLPEGLKDVIVPHEIVQKLKRGEVVVCEEKIFLPSEYEFSGRNRWAEYNGVDRQFEFTEEERNRVAYDDYGDTMWYWTADPSSANTTAFCAFDYTGRSNHHGAHNEGGVAPLFVIS